MTNPIEFINHIDNNNELKIKLIVFNIIEYLSTKYNMNISEILFGEDKCFCKFDSYKEKINNSLHIPFKIDENNISTKYLKIIDFVSIYNVNNTYIANFVFIILHEIGHLIFLSDMYNKLSNKIYKLHDVNESIRKILHLGLSVINLNEEEKTYFHYFDITEQLANIFAYENFYEIWKMLEYRRLI